jgi:hypothetical protein
MQLVSTWVAGRFNRATAMSHTVESRNVARVDEDEMASNRRPLDVPFDAAMMQNGIFGPLLPVFPIDSFDEIADHVRTQPKPPAQHIRSTIDSFVSTGLVAHIVRRSHSQRMRRHPESQMPIGGVDNSGWAPITASTVPCVVVPAQASLGQPAGTRVTVFRNRPSPWAGAS